MQKIILETIGTHLEILLDTEVSIEKIEQEISQRLWDFEKKFSRFIENNWLHTLNRARKWFLDRDAKNMLSYMLGLSRQTDGYFDPTVWKTLTNLGYGNRKIIAEDSIKITRKNGNYRDIELFGDEILLHGDISLEFGGIGKWYLIDILVSLFQDFERFLINFWGDFYGRGGWNIGLESPFASDEIIGTISLENDFLACSAPTRRRWWNQHHLIDPHSLEPSREVIAAYIEVAGEKEYGGMTSDGYATTLCVMPWELAKSTLKKTPDISGVIVAYDGTLFQKEGSRSDIFE